MRKLATLKLMILLLTIFSLASNLLADTYTATISAKTWSAYGNQTIGTAVWNATATAGAYWGYDATKGQQFGSSGSPANPLIITTSSIPGTITDIKITTSGASSVAATLEVTVSGAGFKTAGASTATLTSTSTTYDFTGSAAGTIQLIWNQTSSKALYLKSIEVTYTTCTASNIAFANSTVNKFIVGDPSYQTPTSLSSGSIAYSSSVPAVATVNSTTGEVTPLTVGTTIITATQAASGTFCAASASYTLNVTALPTLTVTDITNPVLVSNDGAQTSQTINISAVNLTTDLGLTISGINANLFTLSNYSITQTGGNVPTTAVTINYSPIIGTNHSAVLTVSSTGAMDLVRPLMGINNGPTTVNQLVSNALTITNTNGKLSFDAVAGESAAIYNAVGQKLYNGITTDGINSVQISAHGVVLVRVGNRQAKVII